MTILLAAGERVLVDARVIEGRSEIDGSLISGESLPQPVAQGSVLRAGMLSRSSLSDERPKRCFLSRAICTLSRSISSAFARSPAQAAASSAACAATSRCSTSMSSGSSAAGGVRRHGTHRRAAVTYPSPASGEL